MRTFSVLSLSLFVSTSLFGFPSKVVVKSPSQFYCLKMTEDSLLEVTYDGGMSHLDFSLLSKKQPKLPSTVTDEFNLDQFEYLEGEKERSVQLSASGARNQTLSAKLTVYLNASTYYNQPSVLKDEPIEVTVEKTKERVSLYSRKATFSVTKLLPNGEETSSFTDLECIVNISDLLSNSSYSSELYSPFVSPTEFQTEKLLRILNAR